MKNGKITLVLFGLLLFWYSLIFVDIPGLTTEGRADIISLMGFLELLLLMVLIAYLIKWKYSDFLYLIILTLWGYLQYQGNWRYLFLRPSNEVLNSYYDHFQGTLRIFPESDKWIVPDAYHIILGLLILVNILFILIKIIKNLK